MMKVRNFEWDDLLILHGEPPDLTLICKENNKPPIINPTFNGVFPFDLSKPIGYWAFEMMASEPCMRVASETLSYTSHYAKFFINDNELEPDRFPIDIFSQKTIRIDVVFDKSKKETIVPKEHLFQEAYAHSFGYIRVINKGDGSFVKLDEAIKAGWLEPEKNHQYVSTPSQGGWKLIDGHWVSR
jgi:hypothetical protein